MSEPTPLVREAITYRASYHAEHYQQQGSICHLVP